MRIPFRHIAGHLVWSVSGTVWAVWRVAPAGGRYAAPQVRDELLGRVTSLIRSLAGAPRLFGLAARVDPGEVAEQMVEGVDWQRLPAWAEMTAAALDLLDGQEMHRRTLWLAVPLTGRGSRFDLSANGSAVWAELSGLLGLAPTPVAADEVAEYAGRAERVQSALGGGLTLRPARPAEIVWMVQHAVHRGLEEPLLSDAEESSQFGGLVRQEVLRSPSYSHLGQIRITEGGRSTQSNEGAPGRRAAGRGRTARSEGSWWREGGASPLGRRWLQVECEDGTGYQAHLALAEVPAAQALDSADLLAQLEALDFPVDFTVDMQVVPADRALEQVRRKKKDLLDQAEQYGARPLGMPHSVPEAAGDLAEEDARLSRSSVEVEVQSVTVLTVWGPDSEVCDARARTLASLLSGGDYRAVRPHGMQEALLSLGLPGAVRPAAVREFTQHQLSEDWAACGAFTNTRLGDPTGAMIGVDLDSGTARPVLINLADAPQHNASASMGIVGDLGGGKSVLEKLLTAAVADRGGRAIIIDRTPIREWATFAESAAAGRCQVIDAAKAQVSIDPLRVFGGPVGAHYALSYLTLQLGIGPMSASGAVLHHAVEEAAAGPEPSMASALRVLRKLATSRSAGAARRDAAATMSELLRIVSANPLARMIFDPALAPVTLDGDLGADMVVMTTAGLTLPPREAFADVEVLRQQPLEALIGRAVLYLVAAIARQAAFSDPSRFCTVAMDEVYWLTSSAEGSALIHEILHDGRKHGAGCLLAAHDSDELGKDAGLLAYKVLARTSDQARARKGLAFLGLDPDDEDLVRLVTTGLSPVGQLGREGEMLLRDPRMQVGRIKVHVPPVPRIERAIYTTPGSDRTTGPKDSGSASAGGPRAEF
ncbi:ATP-binding protein [Streptomyces sp. NPDC001493]